MIFAVSRLVTSLGWQALLLRWLYPLPLIVSAV